MSRVYRLRLHVVAVVMVTAITWHAVSVAAQGPGNVTGDPFHPMTLLVPPGTCAPPANNNYTVCILIVAMLAIH